MHRVDTATAVAVKPASEAAGVAGFFTKGDPVGGVPATVPSQDWFNMVQEELVAVVLAAGLSLDATKANFGQLLAALQVLGLQDATNALKGKIELATDAEVQAGTDAVRAVTPAGLASFAKSLTDTGYQKLPGGLILQWYTDLTNLNAGTGRDITWPIAFPSAARAVVATALATNDTDDMMIATRNRSATGVRIVNPGGFALSGFHVFAIGN